MTKTWLSDPDLMEQELLSNGIPHHYYDQMTSLAQMAVVTHSLARREHQAMTSLVDQEVIRLSALPVLKRPIYQPNPNISLDKAIDQSLMPAHWPTTALSLSGGNLSLEFAEGILARLRQTEANPDLPTFKGIDQHDGIWLAKSLNAPLLVACPPELERDWVRYATVTHQMRTYPVLHSGLDHQRSHHPADMMPVEALWRITSQKEDAWVRLNLLSGASALHSLVLPDPDELKAGN